MTATTPTGIPIIDCDTCGHRHPVTRVHCPVCGLATLFGHGAHRMTATTWTDPVELTFLPPVIRDVWSDDPDRLTRRGVV